MKTFFCCVDCNNSSDAVLYVDGTRQSTGNLRRRFQQSEIPVEILVQLKNGKREFVTGAGTKTKEQ